MNFTRTIVAAALVAAASVSIVSAQTGSITVKVVDSNGDPLPAATVTIRHATGYVPETGVRTDKNGVAEFQVLRAGAGYSINVEMPGFAAIQIPDLRVNIGSSQTRTVRLSEAIVEQVEVIATTDLVDLADTSHTTKFSADFIRDLPVPGRLYQNMLTLAPGVEDADGDGNPNVHGSRDRDFKAEVSGISNVDPLTGRRMSEVNPNSIEEIEVITAGAGVEFSRAQGGFARILQRQGSNEFEGILDFYYRSSLLDGTGAANNDNTFKPDFETIQPGFQLSGPIIQDKLWYRLSHQWIYRDVPVPTSNGLAVQTDNQQIHADQITWQVSQRNKLAFQYQSDPRSIDNLGVSDLRPAEASLARNSSVNQYSVTWTAPYSPKILVNSQVSWQDFSIESGPSSAGGSSHNDCLVAGPEAIIRAQCRNLDTGQLSGGHFEDVSQNRQRLTVRGDTTVYAGRFAGASHQFEFGLMVENERYRRELTRRPTIDLRVLRGEEDNDGDSGAKAWVYGDFSVPQDSALTAKGSTWGVYAKDQIKPAPNLTLTVGVRVDREEIRSDGMLPFDPAAEAARYRELVERFGGIQSNGNCGQPCVRASQLAFTKYERLEQFLKGLDQQLGGSVSQARAPITVSLAHWRPVRTQESIAISNTNFAPRLSLSWDPWKNAKTVFALTAGRYYGNIPLAIPTLELEPPSATLGFEATAYGSGFAIPVREGRISLLDGVNPAVHVDTVDRDLRTPYQDEWTLSFERQIAAETSIKVSYINRRSKDQLQDIDINHAPADLGKCTPSLPSDPKRVVVPIVPELGDEYAQLAQFAPGNGVVDDCQGRLETFLPPPTPTDSDPDPVELHVPDGIPDLYVQNPGWGDILLLGNFNRIQYDGIVLELIRRQYRSWEMTASYRWSQTFGDGEDYNQSLGDDQSLILDEQGFQAYDERHVVKVNATTITPWGFRLGGTVSWRSGLPWSIMLRDRSYDAIPNDFGTLEPSQTARTRGFYPTGQRNDQRSDSWWNVDMKLSKEFRLGSSLNIQASLEIFNLLNDDTYRIYDPFSATGFQINGNNSGFRQFGRRWQIGARFAF